MFCQMVSTTTSCTATLPNLSLHPNVPQRASPTSQSSDLKGQAARNHRVCDGGLGLWPHWFKDTKADEPRSHPFAWFFSCLA